MKLVHIVVGYEHFDTGLEIGEGIKRVCISIYRLLYSHVRDG